MEYKIIRSYRKSLSIEVGKLGVVIRAPVGFPAFFIDNFVQQKKHWIEKQVTKLARQNKLLKNRFFLWGQPYKIQVKNSNYNQLKIKGNKCFILKNESAKTSDIVDNFLLEKTKRFVTQVIEQNYHHFIPRLPKLIFKKYQTKWGGLFG